ncbi:Acetylcholinesterase [Psilocybe cubensis]|uniref:Carboxylic ester hydrolase n=2 Tax=Psilocybe cubensis TaxID=181762 RepID=A0A8H7XNA8_PSICU|nr:Acetylcholinesterase [Psilocybe cubensis]KAH9481822.1 Acetylcholinesterase [Psilocybe cubensis]
MLLSAVLVALASYAYRDTLLALASPSAILDASQAADIVDTGYARYLGNRSFPNTVAFLGVPYAEPPLGERRFRAPLPLDKARIAREARGKVVDVTKNPAFCIQGTTGGYVFGNPVNWPFDHWINQSPNVVIVSVYYRLSSFGFLASPAMRDPAVGDLNAGFLDQIQALKWVKENIASFGGNPDMVTINGESAGGSSTELHLVANEGEKLFNAAIAQSVYRTPLPTPEQQEPLFNFYANHAGCGTGSAADQIACLRKASVSALAMAQDAAVTSAFTASGYNTFHPVIDGKTLTDFPTKSILAGNFAKVPLIVGATTNETLSGGSSVSGALKGFFPSITDSDVNALLDAYPLSEFSSSLQFQTITGDAELRCARSILGTEFGKAQKSWTYRYNQPTPGANAVFHAAENFMMFKGTSTGFNGTTTFNALTPTQNAFAQELIAYWLSFVRTHDPNTFKLSRSPTWQPFTTKNSRIVLQEGPGDTTTVSGSFLETQGTEETDRCNLIASQVLSQQN